MKRKANSFLMIALLLLLMVLVGYFLLAYYYREGFCLNTWINGVYCTGKTVEEVNAELLTETEAPIVIITDKDGESYQIDMSRMEYRGDFLPALNRYMEEQNPFLWIDNITFHQNHNLAPDASYNEELLKTAFEELEFVQREQQRLTDYLLVLNRQEGYLLYDGLSDRLDVNKAFQALQEAIDAGEYNISLEETDCYYDIPLTEEQQKTRELWEKVEKFKQCNLVFDMGDEKIPLDPVVMSELIKTENGGIVLDEKGNLIPDENAVTEFIASIAEEYDTYKKERQFQSTRGDVITVKGVTYGTKINQEAETEYLMAYLLSDLRDSEEELIHIPEYEKEGIVRGKDDIGQTYIEVDMTDQKLYYYEEGELRLETDVVTGNAGRKMGTPEGVNYVYNKQKNRILRGPDYASPVKYWMPVKGNIGIHDASWRSEFGGTIYKTGGSHGCINTPTEKMAELYEMVEIGTPVIMFY